MNIRKHRKIIMLAVVVAMLLQLVGGALHVGAEGDVLSGNITANLTDLDIKVSQNGNELEEGSVLTDTDVVSVDISFRVPVVGDEPQPANSVQKGDYAIFELTDKFNLQTADPIELKMGSIKVGEVIFLTDPGTKMVSARIDFNGEDDVFNGEYNNVTVTFKANFLYDNSGEAGNEGSYSVFILDKEYTVVVPPAEIIYGLSKSGTIDLANKAIEWTVEINATQNETNIDLSGYKFSDNLSAVGKYVADSFTVNGDIAVPVLVSNPESISYTFPEGSNSPFVIKFQTEIADEKYYSTSQQNIANTAFLLNSEDETKVSNQGTISFTPPQWIEKSGEASDSGSGGVYDPENRTITWSIIANHAGASLNNVVITDVLPDNLVFASANWRAWDSNSSNWLVENSITPNASSEYEIGNISSKILLTIITQVPDQDFTTGTKTYTNTASIRWDSLPESIPSIGTGNVSVTIGYNAITKFGTVNTATEKPRSINWSITVDQKGQAIPDLKVYDLLVYSSISSGFDIDSATGIPAAIDKSGLRPRFNQKYIDNSFAGNASNITVHAIEQSGVRVADLLEITGFDKDNTNIFTFDSLIINPDIFAGNKTSTLSNTAVLYSANAKINEATANVNYTNNLLSKDLLNRSATVDSALVVNSARTSSASLGFDYIDKSVIFRLSINSDELDLANMTDAAGNILGPVTITDTLPVGWQFVDINEEAYLIFEGQKQSGKIVNATITTPTDPDSINGLSADFNPETRSVSFTFTEFKDAYVILLKARPTEETDSGYFDSNKTTTVTNNATISTANWSGVSDSQNVSITSTILNKTHTQPSAGELLWAVDYRPYDTDQKGTRLEDAIPLGIDLRTDSSGNLLLSNEGADYISVTKLHLNSDGSYIEGDKVELILGENIGYDNENRILHFQIPDSSGAYRFRYITDITGEPGQITNKVTLFGFEGSEFETNNSYTINSADGSASLQRNGWIQINKTTGENQVLAGAEFTLFTSDGNTVIRKGITGVDGSVRLRVLPAGEYLLRETAVPEGYSSYDREHIVSVEIEGLSVTTSIDGRTGSESNIIYIQNFIEGTVGNLEIRKNVEGEAAETDRLFEFTVNFTGENENEVNDEFIYFGNGVPDGTIKTGDIILLGHGQSIKIVGIPKNTNYEVIEEDYSDYNYATESIGQSGEIIADETKTAAFTNTYIIPLINITGTKIWENGASNRPNSISLQLYRNDEAYGDAVVLTKVNTSSTSKDVWDYIWTNLPETDNERNPYTYTVDEVVTPPNYIKTIGEDGLTITNTYVIPTTNITANKIWNGGSSQRPSIQIQLYRNGKAMNDILGNEFAPVTLKNGQTSYTWQNLEATDINGKLYKYTVDEIVVPDNYVKKVNGLTITNTYVEPDVPKTPTDPKPDTTSETPTDPVVSESTSNETDNNGIGTIDPIQPNIPTVETPPQNGTITFDEDGNWIYTPNPGFTGEDTFVLRHPDGRLETITVVVEDIPGTGIIVVPKTGEQNSVPFAIGGLLFATAIVLGIRRKYNRPTENPDNE